MKVLEPVPALEAGVSDLSYCSCFEMFETQSDAKDILVVGTKVPPAANQNEAGTLHIIGSTARSFHFNPQKLVEGSRSLWNQVQGIGRNFGQTGRQEEDVNQSNQPLPPGDEKSTKTKSRPPVQIEGNEVGVVALKVDRCSGLLAAVFSSGLVSIRQIATGQEVASTHLLDVHPRNACLGREGQVRVSSAKIASGRSSDEALELALAWEVQELKNYSKVWNFCKIQVSLR